MDAQIVRPDPAGEFMTPERCSIVEVWNDPTDSSASMALARVEPKITTQLLRLNGVSERYLIVQGTGMVRVGQNLFEGVSQGDAVLIPAGTPQQISNVGDGDLLFYCICTPRFSLECYESLD